MTDIEPLLRWNVCANFRKVIFRSDKTCVNEAKWIFNKIFKFNVIELAALENDGEGLHGLSLIFYLGKDQIYRYNIGLFCLSIENSDKYLVKVHEFILLHEE